MTDPAADPQKDEQPGLRALLGQLADDTSAFAKAEIDLLKQEAGERASYIVPGLAMIGVGVAIALAVIVAAFVGIMLWLTPLIGAGWSALGVASGGLLLSAALFKLGAIKFRKIFKPREER